MGSSGHFYSFLFICGPGVVVVKICDRLPTIWDRLYLGLTPRTKETMPDFHEWCRVTRHPRVFYTPSGLLHPFRSFTPI